MASRANGSPATNTGQAYVPSSGPASTPTAASARGDKDGKSGLPERPRHLVEAKQQVAVKAQEERGKGPVKQAGPPPKAPETGKEDDDKSGEDKEGDQDAPKEEEAAPPELEAVEEEPQEVDADPQPAVIFEELPVVPAGLELQGDLPADYAGDRARSRVLGIQDRLRVVAVTQKVAMGIRSDELRAQVWSAASSARRRVRTAEDTARGAVSTAVGKAKRHLLQQARDSLVAVGKRLGSVRKEVRKGAVTGVKATVAINELNRKGAVKAR